MSGAARYCDWRRLFISATTVGDQELALLCWMGFNKLATVLHSSPRILIHSSSYSLTSLYSILFLTKPVPPRPGRSTRNASSKTT